MKQIIVTILLFTAFHFAQSQTVVWKDITPKDYYCYKYKTSLVYDGRIIAASTNGKIAESSDTGKTWQVTHYMVEYDKNAAIHQRSPETFELKQLEFAQNKTNGIYTGVYVYEHDAQTKYRTQVIHYTTDGGKTWHIPQTDFSNKEVIHLCWKTNDSVFATVYDRNTKQTYMYVSANAGKQWNTTDSPVLTQPNTINSSIIYYVAFVNDTLGYALGWQGYNITTDGGKTWSARTTNYDLKPQGVMRFSNGQILIAGDKNVYNIEIAHCRYKRLNSTNSINIWKPHFIKDMGNGVIYANAQEGLIMSVDSGNTWSNKSDNVAIFNYHVLDTNVHVGIDAYTTEVSIDGGLTWTTYNYKGIVEIKYIYAKTEDEYYMFGDYAREFSRIFRTTDRGETWTYTDVTAVWGTIQSLETMQFVTPDTAYISARSNLHRSVDGGETWQPFRKPDKGYYMQFLTPNIGYSGPDDWGGMNKTTNGGQTWEDASGMYVDDTYFDYEGTGYASFKTIDEGLVGGNTGLLYTQNGGSSWEFKDVGFTGTCYSVGNNWIITDRLGGKIYTCDADFNCSKTYEIQGFTKQYDRMWQMIRLDENTLIVPIDNINLSHSKDSALISTDGGLSWEQKYFPYPYDYDNIMVLNKYTLYAAARGNIYKGVYTYETTSNSFTFNTATNTVECLITTEADEEFGAAILLVTSSGETTVLVHNQNIQSNVAFSVSVPQVSENFSIVVKPAYSQVFATSVSQTFTPATAIESVERLTLCKVAEFRASILSARKNYQARNSHASYEKLGNFI